ncbi:hypothetical protein CFB81_34885 [Burkholderia sp. AU28863]|uniref:hypothetical protein n=1 Tax=Burkholderia sp. AU28863 TaxID=2015352 RepID=UPI000B7A76FD|nr:hypothetical protein [Burkholderia sp. AU28863]OXI61683.1 hypothetical protein CFB81_34885 [Burkholderia sp. AU28863]
MSDSPDYWRDEMSEAIARRVLGTHFHYAIVQGVGFCASHAAGAWQANLAESFGAYKTAERIASHTKARIGNKADDFSAAIVHTGAMDYCVHLSSGDEVGGFRQLGEAVTWANRTVQLGKAEWAERKRHAPK